MSDIIEMKCPNCGGELTLTKTGGFICEYCDSRFSSESELEGKKAYLQEKGKIEAWEEQREREQQAAEESQKQAEVEPAENVRRRKRNQLIGGGAVILSAALFIIGKTSQSLALTIIGVVLWFFAGIFAILQSTKQKKSGALLIIIMMIVAAIVGCSIKGGTKTGSDNNAQPVAENAAADDSGAEGAVSKNTSPYTDINDFYYSVDTAAMTITLNDFKPEARERDTNIVLASQYTLNGAVYSLTAIGDDACFMGESHIESVVIPEGVTYIGANTFNSVVNIKTIYLPSTLQVLDPNFFSYLDNETVTFEYGGSEETFNALTNYSNPQGNANFVFHFNSELRGGLDEIDRPLSPDERSESEKMGDSLGGAFNGFINGLGGDD